ncbi:MAG: hypothetical protein N2515_08880, partial [Deltaproteobacteria bacterium]|nr:hypothetical protein [Deltaproteobacteria bacterium]
NRCCNNMCVDTNTNRNHCGMCGMMRGSREGCLGGSCRVGPLGLALGWYHTCAWLSDGSARCWGRNRFGQLGDGTTTNRSTPVMVSGLSGVTAIATGLEHTCALLGSGEVRCWGYNLYGQLGDGTTTNHFTPVTVMGL